MTPPRILGRAHWRYLRHPGTEHATLSSTDRGFHLSGRANLRFPEGPTAVSYAIACDTRWRPRKARVELRRRRSRQSLRLEVNEDGEWEIDGFRRRDLQGYTDFDLSASPSTNTLAVRRLDLPVGAQAEIRTGWVLFPDLEVHPVRQRYRRISETRYRYEGLNNGFVAEFSVDRLGLVVDYPGFWDRVEPAARPRGARGRRSAPRINP